ITVPRGAMADSVLCPTCGREVQFENEDRGIEVYCGSCGHACAVPAEPECSEPQTVDNLRGRFTAGSPRTKRATRVFGVPGDAATHSQILRDLPCSHCGRAIPIAVEDYGSPVYCPSCGAESLFGETLGNPAPPEPVRPPVVPDTGPPSQRRPVRT